MQVHTNPPLLTMALVLFLGACAQPGGQVANTEFAGRVEVRQSSTAQDSNAGTRAIQSRVSLQRRHLDLIATDLVTSMVQLIELSPYSTTIQISTPPTAFGRALVKALRYSGYGLQQVSFDQGIRYLSYGSRITQNNVGQFTDFFVTVGSITLTRAYSVDRGAVVPASKMTIIGSRSQTNIALNDKIFLQQSGDVAFQNSVEVITPDDVSVINHRRRASGIKAPVPGNYTDQKRSLAWAREVLAGSRFDDTILKELQQYTPMFQSELSFIDESIYLGMTNKEAIESLYSQFDSGTDVFTLVSCTSQGISTPQTRQHRARIKEELLYLGAPIDSVVYSSCPQDDGDRALINQVENQIIPRDFVPGLVVITQYRTKDRTQLTENAPET